MNRLTMTDLIKRYQHALNNDFPDRVKLYGDRLKNCHASAKAEAVLFSFFDTKVDDVCLEESTEKGGVDFRCKIDETEFVAEVTHLESENVACASGLKNEIESRVSSYKSITHLLRSKVSSKTKQMSGYDCPRILVITSDHQAATILMSHKIAAERLLTSDTKISIPNPTSNLKSSHGFETSLEESVFFRFKKGTDEIESCRQSISAILLCAICKFDMRIVGLLHPAPMRKFPIQYLPSIPFVRLKEWPLENKVIHTEWVTYERRGQDGIVLALRRSKRYSLMKGRS
ncbi:MAG: hypothetical protein OXH00_11950 [Candidatus Poribacteria bacterium]|nr:hypothetical protein [Candidatus Poribacteria bacterium]